MFTNFVPISLLVTLEGVKFVQSFVLAADVQMYDGEADQAMRVQSSNLNEELGQIEYIFSDKTGTLT
jgi:P-type E1-E2 ATPase